MADVNGHDFEEEFSMEEDLSPYEHYVLSKAEVLRSLDMYLIYGLTLGALAFIPIISVIWVTAWRYIF